MKKHLYISHVGPITGEVNIDLKRFNVFIGPQSSGKSTIAKLISTFSWIEKEACTTLSKDIFPGGKGFVSYTEDYHRMHGYFQEDSVVRYESEYIRVEYNKGDFSISFTDKSLDYSRVKVTYVPSDRNVITLRDIEKRELGETNFRSFLFDWLDARRYYDSAHKADLLNLDVKYYYDSKRIEYQDRITHHNGQSYEIALYDASSGLQSAVPLVVLITYLKKLYFVNYRKEFSYESQKRENELAIRLIDRLLVPYVNHTEDETPSAIFRRTTQEMIDGNTSYRKYFENIQKALNNLISPHSIAYIIEEPEQNLFPVTQCDLTKNIIAACNDKEHLGSAVITTHSPYVLAMINSQILAGLLLKRGVNEQIIDKIIPVSCAIDEDEIGVYAIDEGSCKSIKDKEMGMINQNYLDTASEYIAASFDKLYTLYIKTLK